MKNESLKSMNQLNIESMKCENKNHKGENPPKLNNKEKELFWWLKDPEWENWCPRCTYKYFKDVMFA